MGYGWVENVVDSTRFDRIDTNRFPCSRCVMPEVDLPDASSVQIESRRNVRIESNRQVLQTNQLNFCVLDIDGCVNLEESTP